MKKLFCAAAFIAAVSASAETVYWTGAAGSMQWGVAENWIDASGTPLTVAPTNGTHDVKIPALPSDNDGSRREISTGSLSGSDGNVYLEYPAVNPVIASIGPSNYVYDTWMWTVNFATRATGTRHTPFKRFFTVSDPNDFEGCWTTGDSKSTIELAATAGFEPTLHSLSARCRPYVRVPDSGTAGAVGSLFRPGTVSKSGEGELRVATTLGEDSRFTVEAGTLTFDGSDGDAEVEALLETAALRLDATRADTFETYKKTTDGVEYTIVDKWHDANGNGLYGYEEKTYDTGGQYFYPYSHGAFMSPAKSPTGLPLVDFGSHCKDEGRFGPSNCWLRLSKTVKDPREVFYAVQTPGGTGGCTVLGALDDGLAFLVERNDIYLFCRYSAGAIGRNGDIMINGESVPYFETDQHTESTLTNVSVVSVAVRPGAKVGLLGSDRHYTSRSGGSRLGEVLLFTNQLTRAQRVRIAQYLTRRWVTGDKPGLDADAVLVKTGDGAIGVSDGREARVGTVAAKSGRLRKTGGGALVVGGVEPRDTVIDVEGGSVSMSPAPEIATGAPAADPYIWLDANETSTLVKETVDGRTYVSEWKDCREGSGMTALAISNAPPRMPYLVSDIGNGRGAGISLGKRTETTQSWFALPNWGKDGAYGSGSSVANDTYAGFIVFRMNVLNNSHNIFGSSTLQMMRGNYNSLLTTSYCDSKSPSAFWSVNGRPVDPWDNVSATVNQTNDLVLVAFRSRTPLTVNAITKDRKGEQHPSAGNMTVGEFITYHRPLSRDEFIATEAYLLAKWMGTDHPAKDAGMSGVTLAFGGETSVRVHGDGDSAVARLSGGDGTFVKTGAGAVTVAEAVAPECITDSVTVEGGALVADVALDAKAYFHFDASRTDSLDTYKGDDGKTYVRFWRDTGTNGLYACSMTRHPTTRYKFVKSDPTLIDAEMPDGKKRAVVDFGNMRNTGNTDETHPASVNAASVYLSAGAFGETASRKKVREIYIVQSCTGANAHFIGHLNGGAVRPENGSVYFQRGGSGIFYPTYTSYFIQNGYIALDRTPRAVSYTMPLNTWCLVSVGATDYVTVDSFMHDRNCNAGGGSIAEVIAFDFPLTAAERAALEQRLMRKWGIGDEAPPTVVSTDVSVADGASLALGDCMLATSALGGGGTVSATGVSVADGGTLSFGYRSRSDVDHLRIKGALTLDGSYTVKVDVADPDAAGDGDHTLLSATEGIEGLDLADLTLSADFGSRWKARLFTRDGTLCLRIRPKGFVLLVR